MDLGKKRGSSAGAGQCWHQAMKVSLIWRILVLVMNFHLLDFHHAMIQNLAVMQAGFKYASVQQSTNLALCRARLILLPRYQRIWVDRPTVTRCPAEASPIDLDTPAFTRYFSRSFFHTRT